MSVVVETGDVIFPSDITATLIIDLICIVVLCFPACLCSASVLQPLVCPSLLFLPAGVLFTKHPANQTVSQGNAVRLGCAVQGVTEPDVLWRKDGEKLYGTDQMFITLGEQHWETFHRWASQSGD